MSNIEQLDTEMNLLISEMESALAEYEQGLSHIDQFGNVHNLSKYDLELSHMHNMSLANLSDTLGRVENKYHSAGGTFLILERSAISNLLAHIANRNNPHNMTLAQLDMLSEAQIRDLYTNKLLKTETAYDSSTLNGMTREQLISQTKTNLDASDIAEGLIPADRYADTLPFNMFGATATYSNTLAPSNVMSRFLEDGETPREFDRFWTTVESPARIVLSQDDLEHFYSITDQEVRSHYGADITLSSESNNDGWLGFIIADISDLETKRQFVARVKPAKDTPGQFEICLVEDGIATTLTSLEHDLGNNRQDGWNGKLIRMRIERMDTFARVTVSDWDSTVLNLNLVLSIDLTEYNATAPAPMGYFAQGGSMATFANTTFSTTSTDGYALTGANSFIHMLTALTDAGISTGNFHLMEGHYDTVADCWSAMQGANVPIGTYLIGHYRNSFNWHVTEAGLGYGISQTHYMFNMVAGRRNTNGTTTRIF